MGRPPTGYTEQLRFGMRPASAQALSLLSESTGLAKKHLVRLAVDKYLADLGLLMPVDLPPTVVAGPTAGKEK